MCGIAGCVSVDGRSPPEEEALERALAALLHRGPDELGVLLDHRVGLAHARLSIIDLASGQQPLSNEDGTLWLVFNGEIFNYVELRAELSARGHTFRTHSDTEVIVHAWEQWGVEALERFNGQWAFALWDRRRGELVLSRDRVGVRPLYYAEHAGQLVFASEIKAIFAAAPTLPRAFDPVGLDQCFTWWTMIAPRTAFLGVAELEPGHVRVYRFGGGREPTIEDRAYWTPSFPGDFGGRLDDGAAQARAALERATELRMLRAEVEVGCYLSGGLDSSLIATLGRRAKGAGFHTFSLRFADAEYDEGRYQRVMARALDAEHHEVTVTRRDIAEVFPAVCRHAERPLLRSAPAPMFLLSRLVREHGIKVVLTGEGADELFAGYDLFREGAVRRFWAREPASQVRPRLLERLYPYLARSPVAQRAMSQAFFGRGLERWREPGFAHQLRWQTTSGIKRLLVEAVRCTPGATLPDGLPDEFSEWSHLAQDQYLEIRTLMSGYLLSAQGDRMLMANSIEGRFPFLDRDVLELAGRLPDSFKLRGLDEKHVLKRLSAELLPEEVRRRPKQPYRAPDALAFVGADAPAWIGELLTPEALAAGGVFQPQSAARLWEKCNARATSAQFSNADNMAVVSMLSTQLVWQNVLRAALPGPLRPRVNTRVDLRGPQTDSRKSL
ncbi:MAG: asparagine synthase (glutamine-hydrolyzing) [Kofleriaceae bacterium]